MQKKERFFALTRSVVLSGPFRAIRDVAVRFPDRIASDPLSRLDPQFPQHALLMTTAEDRNSLPDGGTIRDATNARWKWVRVVFPGSIFIRNENEFEDAFKNGLSFLPIEDSPRDSNCKMKWRKTRERLSEPREKENQTARSVFISISFSLSLILGCVIFLTTRSDISAQKNISERSRIV